MKLFDEYVKDVGVDLEQTMLRVPVKFRDKLCFKGMKVDYDKLTYFVVRDGKYLPLFTVNDVKDTDLVLNLYPLICVGLSEILFTASNTGDETGLHFLEELISNEDVLKGESDLIHFANMVVQSNLKENEHEFEVLCALRSDYTPCSFHTTRQLVATMACCYFTNPKLFCEALLESMKFAYSTCTLYTTDCSEIANLCVGDGDCTKFDICEMVTKSSLRPKRIGYKIPRGTSKHYISNCRGLGIYAYLILFFEIYDKFGEALSSACANIKIKDAKTKEFLQKQFVGCLGDDFVGNYYKTGKMKLKLCNKSYAYPTLQQGAVPINSGTLYTLDDDSKVTRDVYENEILWRRANHVNFAKVNDGLFIRNAETYYVKLIDFYGVAFSCFADNYKFDTTVENFHYVSKEYVTEVVRNELYSKARDKADAEQLKKKYNEDLEKISEEHKHYCEAYDKKIEELNAIIASKSNIIEQLTSELKETNDSLQGYYSEEDFEETVEESGVSLEEAIEFLNQFKITMVGGRIDLLQKLTALGLTGVVQVDSANMLNGTPITSDFFCINTKFVSHKTAYNVESRYKEQKSQMFYFNGTNVEALIRACYDFIMKWMD